MLARESNANYASRRREMTNYTIREIKRVCKEIGPRESGEESERKAQAYIAESMKNVADTVEVEDFELHPKAFMGWVLLDVVMMLISATLFFFGRLDFAAAQQMPLTIAALVLSTLSIFFMVFEFLFYKEVLDPFFPKRKTCNVICRRAPKGEIKKRIIFAGHIDSAYEWTYTHLGGGKLLTTVIILAFGSVFIHFAIDIIGLFNVPQWLDTTIFVVGIVCTFPIILGAFFVNWKRVVPGANDNLTGVFASLSILQYMAMNDIRFENTEVVGVSMACEEAGLRGAKAFAKKHANEDDVETVFVATDTLRDFDFMGVYNKDMSGTVKLDPQAAAMLKKASETAGYNLDYANVFFGSSDAAAIQQGGMKAVALAAMDPTPARYYHTRRDTADNLDPKSIEAGIDILLETAFLFDTEGLKDNYQ